jgi:hypothetical protein
MIKGMARLMTGGDIAKMLIAILFGAGLVGIVAAGMHGGIGRTLVLGVIGVATVGVVLQSGVGVFRRYNQLNSGKCPNPLCHGVVQRSELVRKGDVVCPTCRRTWPELEDMSFKATARG